MIGKPDRHAPRNGLSFLATNVPRFSADEREQVPRAMHDSKNEYLVILQKIDDAVLSEQNFSKIGATELRYHSTEVGILEQRFSSFNDAIAECDRMEDGIAGDKVFDVLKMFPAVNDQRTCAIGQLFPSAILA
jgi:hypothetical protein